MCKILCALCMRHTYGQCIYLARDILPLLLYIYLVCNFLVCASHFNCFVFISCLWVSVSFRFCLLCVCIFSLFFSFSSTEEHFFIVVVVVLKYCQIDCKWKLVQYTSWRVEALSIFLMMAYSTREIHFRNTKLSTQQCMYIINTDTIKAFASKFIVRNKFIA